MNSRTIMRCTVFLLGLLSFYSCSANTYGVRKVQFVQPHSPGNLETSIFVFREKTGYGAARKFAIVCNDTVMGVLTSGTFCHFNVESGENEIVAYMTGPIMHYRVQNRPGETVYLFCKMGYASGMFIEEINEAEAEKYMNEFKYTEIDMKGRKTEINYKDYYDRLFQ